MLTSKQTNQKQQTVSQQASQQRHHPQQQQPQQRQKQPTSQQRKNASNHDQKHHKTIKEENLDKSKEATTIFGNQINKGYGSQQYEQVIAHTTINSNAQTESSISIFILVFVCSVASQSNIQPRWPINQLAFIRRNINRNLITIKTMQIYRIISVRRI